ncbi:MAG: hypothetical protein GF353_09090 [Candidatus Lokiarchaeota archaeon]|nr:hypothetical protein [Candidatus Lokiarchaeota archaeon]
MVIRTHKDSKDINFEEFKVVKRYFSRIFTVLSDEMRERLIRLNLSDDQKNEIKKELSFLSINKQREYLEELKQIYKNMLKGY